MHPILELEEIVRLIVKHVGDPAVLPLFGPSPRRERRLCLLSMALTCRSFYLPAIESLWYTLVGLAPILYCFPEHIWSKLGAHQFAGPHLPPNEEDWERVLVMASHVRKLQVVAPPSDANDAHSQAVRFLCAHQPTSIRPFPNLQKLSWNGGLQHFSAHCLSSFMGSNLKDVQLYQTNDFDMAFFVQILSRHAPSLEQCGLKGLVLSQEHMKTSLMFATNGHLFQNLTQLVCKQIFLSNAAIFRLGTLTNLMHLACVIENSEDYPNLSCDAILNLFPSLQALVITIMHPSRWFSTFLKRCRMPKLREFCSIVDLAGDFWSEATLSVADALSSHPSVAVCVLGPSEVYPTDPLRKCTQEIIKPLLTCSSLTRLIIGGGLSSGLDDAFLHAIGRALPHLKALHFKFHDNIGSISYKGLHALAIQCPQLTDVILPLDFRTLDESDLHPPARLPLCASLKTIKNSSVCTREETSSVDLLLVAAVMTATFPSALLEWPSLSGSLSRSSELSRILRLFRLAIPRPL